MSTRTYPAGGDLAPLSPTEEAKVADACVLRKGKPAAGSVVATVNAILAARDEASRQRGNDEEENGVTGNNRGWGVEHTGAGASEEAWPT